MEKMWDPTPMSAHLNSLGAHLETAGTFGQQVEHACDASIHVSRLAYLERYQS